MTTTEPANQPRPCDARPPLSQLSTSEAEAGLSRWVWSPAPSEPSQWAGRAERGTPPLPWPHTGGSFVLGFRWDVEAAMAGAGCGATLQEIWGDPGAARGSRTLRMSIPTVTLPPLQDSFLRLMPSVPEGEAVGRGTGALGAGRAGKVACGRGRRLRGNQRGPGCREGSRGTRDKTAPRSSGPRGPTEDRARPGPPPLGSVVSVVP